LPRVAGDQDMLQPRGDGELGGSWRDAVLVTPFDGSQKALRTFWEPSEAICFVVWRS
jgi:hypothetical protein